MSLLTFVRNRLPVLPPPRLLAKLGLKPPSPTPSPGPVTTILGRRVVINVPELTVLEERGRSH